MFSEGRYHLEVESVRLEVQDVIIPLKIGQHLLEVLCFTLDNSHILNEHGFSIHQVVSLVVFSLHTNQK